VAGGFNINDTGTYNISAVEIYDPATDPLDPRGRHADGTRERRTRSPEKRVGARDRRRVHGTTTPQRVKY